jgi:hypothetical protein
MNPFYCRRGMRNVCHTVVGIVEAAALERSELGEIWTWRRQNEPVDEVRTDVTCSKKDMTGSNYLVLSPSSANTDIVTDAEDVRDPTYNGWQARKCAETGSVPHSTRLGSVQSRLC